MITAFAGKPFDDSLVARAQRTLGPSPAGVTPRAAQMRAFGSTSRDATATISPPATISPTAPASPTLLPAPYSDATASPTLLPAPYSDATGLPAAPPATSLPPTVPPTVPPAVPPAATAPATMAVTQAGPIGPAAARMYGASRSGLPWLSGFWTGGYGSAAHLAAAELWRGSPMDFATTYPAYSTWDELASDTFAISTFDGFAGRLAYGLPMLPADRRGQWSDVTSGAHDEVFREIARQLLLHGRADSVVRVGLEANGSWFPWGATAATADQFRAAFRRIVTVMRAQAPRLTFWFDTSAGSALTGGAGRLDALTALYPGDDVVDGVSMDHFDFYQLVAHDDASFAAAMRPSSGPGLADAADFARAHGKGFGVPEWGLHSTQGPGDNPFFIRAMFGFFTANDDVLVFEDYFNEPDPYIANALFDASDAPQSAAVYRALWTSPR